MSLRLPFVFVGLSLFFSANAQNPVVQTILDDMRIDSMMKWVGELSG